MYVWSPYKVTQFEWLGISERGESYEILQYILSKLMYRRFVAANIHAVIKNANYGIGDKRVTPGGPGGDICLWSWPRSLFNLLTRCNSPPQKGCVTPCTPNHTYNLTPFSLFVIRDFKEEREIRRNGFNIARWQQPEVVYFRSSDAIIYLWPKWNLKETPWTLKESSPFSLVSWMREVRVLGVPRAGCQMETFCTNTVSDQWLSPHLHICIVFLCWILFRPAWIPRSYWGTNMSAL